MQTTRSSRSLPVPSVAWSTPAWKPVPKTLRLLCTHQVVESRTPLLFGNHFAPVSYRDTTATTTRGLGPGTGTGTRYTLTFSWRAVSASPFIADWRGASRRAKVRGEEPPP